MKPKTQYRQGDVYIERIDALPKNLKEKPRENGKVVLAHGEVTGHAHTFTNQKTIAFTSENGGEFFQVKGNWLQGRFAIIRRWKNQVMINHPACGIIEFAECDVAIDHNEVVLDGEFDLLKHDEHHAHGIPAGYYKGGGQHGKVRQREYTPEAIRNVAD